MRSLRLKISDLFEFPGQTPPDLQHNVAALTPLVLQQFGFLPQPLVITVEGEEVLLQFPETSTSAQDEAARLAAKGAKRASEGDHAYAIETLKRALKLEPSLHAARRDLAMAYMALGDNDNATNHLIEVLRLSPTDAWSWVILGNLYLGPKNDPDTGEKFLRRALSLKPGDAWALNSLGTLSHKRGLSAEAVAYFEQAIASAPTLPNPYCGLALAHRALKQPDLAEAALLRLFKQSSPADRLSQPIYEQARQLYVKVQQDLAKRDESEMFKSLQNYRAELETLSGYPIKIQEGEFKGTIGAQIQMAWTHKRNYHLITERRGYAPELLCHLEAHELSHLKIESEARKEGKNQFFTSTSSTHAAAHLALQADAEKLRRSGSTPESIERLHLTLIQGLCGFLFNCPLDMLIERRLRQQFPALRAAQFLSVSVMAAEALRANTNPDVLKVAPRKIVRATLAMNGAYCLFLDDLFEGASNFAGPYRKLENFDMAKRLYQHWQNQSAKVAGGG